jgi:hypothetical protein
MSRLRNNQFRKIRRILQITMSNDKQSFAGWLWSVFAFRHIMDFINLDMDVLYKKKRK